MLLKLLPRSINVVRMERTPDTTLFPSRPQHEVLNNQLAASIEKIA